AWHHPLDASVHEAARKIVVRLPDGRESPHDPLDAGESVWEPIDRYTLLRNKRGYRLTFWDGLSYHFEPVEGAHVSHPLVKITDRCDNPVELRYAQGRLVEVVDSIGRRIELVTEGGRLRAVRLHPAGRAAVELVRYGYDGEGHLSEVLDPA